MAERKAPTKGKQPAAKRATGKAVQGFTDDEKAALKERAREAKAASDGGQADGESEVLANIAQMSEPDRAMAERLHAIVKATAPVLSPRTWYGMPAYAMGFSDKAHLDDGAMWPNAYAVNELTADVEKRIAALVKQAAS